MAEFNPKKQEATSFNNGKYYRNGDGIQAEALNNLIEGVLYAQENGSENSSGLTEEQEAKIEKIVINGNGDKFLADDGEYKEIVGGGTTVTVNGEAVETFDADNKLDKITATGYKKTYGITAQGRQTMYNVASGLLADTLVQRKADNSIAVETPENGNDTDATNRKFVLEKTALYQHNVHLIRTSLDEEGSELETDITLQFLSRDSEPITLENFYSRLGWVYERACIVDWFWLGLIWVYSDESYISIASEYHLFSEDITDTTKDYRWSVDDIVEEINMR